MKKLSKEIEHQCKIQKSRAPRPTACKHNYLTGETLLSMMEHPAPLGQDVPKYLQPYAGWEI